MFVTGFLSIQHSQRCNSIFVGTLMNKDCYCTENRLPLRWEPENGKHW